MVTGVLALVAFLLWRPPTWAPRGVRLPRPARHGRASARRAAERELVESLEAEVRAGSDPAAALLAVSLVASSVCPRAVAAARSGADVVSALELDAGGSELMRGLAAVWSVAHGSGAGLAASLASLSDAARERERLRRELQAGVAEPRATAMVLAALPVFGLALGVMLGAEPWSWLVGTVVGRLVLIAGLGLEAGGVLWSWRITVSAAAGL
jgi:tight adherence protein B